MQNAECRVQMVRRGSRVDTYLPIPIHIGGTYLAGPESLLVFAYYASRDLLHLLGLGLG